VPQVTDDQPAPFCDRCGRKWTEGAHSGCAEARALEPARYCAQCARRMVVQVTPSGWSARCSRHGTVRSGGSGL